MLLCIHSAHLTAVLPLVLLNPHIVMVLLDHITSRVKILCLLNCWQEPRCTRSICTIFNLVLYNYIDSAIRGTRKVMHIHPFVHLKISLYPYITSHRCQNDFYNFLSIFINRVRNWTLTLSILNNIWYWGTKALRGSVSIRTRSSVFNEWNGTRTGNLPTNSCNKPHGTIRFVCNTAAYNSSQAYKSKKRITVSALW
jgi:hypothetical protein